jgi:hypothetical protein
MNKPSSAPPRAAAAVHTVKPSLLQQSIDESAKQLYKELQLQASDLYNQHIAENRESVIAAKQEASRSRQNSTSAKVGRTLVERLAQSEHGIDAVERVASDRLRRALEEKMGRLASTQYYVRANRVYHAAKVGIQRKALEAQGKTTLRKLLERTHPQMSDLRPAAGDSHPETSLSAQMVEERRRTTDALARSTMQRAATPADQRHHRLQGSAEQKPPHHATPTKVGDPGDLDWGPSPAPPTTDVDRSRVSVDVGSPIRPASSSSTAKRSPGDSNRVSRAVSSQGTRSRLLLPPLPHCPDRADGPDPFPEAAERAASALQQRKAKQRTPGGPPRPRSQQSIVSAALKKILARTMERSNSPPLRRDVMSAMSRSSAGGYAVPQGRLLADRMAASRGRKHLDGAKRLAAEWIDEFGSHRPTEAALQAHQQATSAAVMQGRSSVMRQALLAREGLTRPAAPVDGRRRTHDAPGGDEHAQRQEPHINLEEFFLGEFESPPRQEAPHHHHHHHHHADYDSGDASLQGGAPHYGYRPRQQAVHTRDQSNTFTEDVEDDEDPFPMPKEDDPDFASSSSSDEEYDNDNDGDDLSSMSTPRLPESPPKAAVGSHQRECSTSPQIGSDEQSQQRHVLAHNLVLVTVDACVSEPTPL